MPTSDAPYRVAADGLWVVVRLQPGASRNGVDGVVQLDDGTAVLRVRVTAPPEDGRANAALIRLLAREWRLPKGAVTVARGATQRLKTLHLSGDPRLLAPQLASWLVQLAGAGPGAAP